MSELWGVEICLFPLTRLIAYTTACSYRTSRDIGRVIRDFVPNLLAMATSVGRSRICLASFNSTTPQKPLVGHKDLLDISYTSRFIADFVPNFVTMGLVAVEFVWHHSTARPRKPPAGCKDLLDISYTSRLVADSVPNFIAMAVGWSR